MASAISFGAANAGFQAGVINGSVNTAFHHHKSPERLETPSVVIPFSRDKDFVERGILDQIDQKYAVSGSRTALVGLGGVGKSQLAIEYAYRTRDCSPETWVFWIHASNAARFEQSFRDIADRVKIFGRQNPTANIFQLVRDWLLDDRKGKWILILDNLDDAGFLVEAQTTGQDGRTKGTGGRSLRPLVEYLPQCQNGTILITTRTKAAALKLVEENNLIAVEPMKKVHAITLLEKKLRIQGDSDENGKNSDIGDLAAALEYIPLAIVQAAAYISQRAPRCLVSEYLDKFRKSDREKTSLLDNKAGHLRRDREAKNSITITWHISFEHIRQSRPSAVDSLSLISLFDWQGIPEGPVRHRLEIKSPSHFKQDDQQITRSRGIQRLARLFHRKRERHECQLRDEMSSTRVDEFEDDLLTLRNYAFVSISEFQSSFKMYTLVQLAMRTWLEANGQLERWRQHYCKILCTEFPTGEYENWAKCQELFPHALSAVTQQPEDQDSPKDWASIQFMAAWYARRTRNTSESEKLARSSLVVRSIFGEEYSGTIYSMMLLSHAYKDGSRWKEAESLDIHVLEVSKKLFGADHPITLSSMVNLALTYNHQGRWHAAEELRVQVMETRKKKLGADHLTRLSVSLATSLDYSAACLT